MKAYDVVLKKALPEDLDRLMPLVRGYHEFEQIHMSETDRRHAVSLLLENPFYGGIWLIDHRSVPVGYIALCKGYSIEFGGFDAFVDEFYIMEEHRGRGLGRWTLAAIQKEAAELGVKALHLEVARDNHKAIALYKACGFQQREKYTLMSALV